ncbi:MAG: hypothetical protein O7A03_04865, partial [Alphaproteobacteria bacterium]|nr:hypothetical protein [Alphaproteobacteria bacterium]
VDVIATCAALFATAGFTFDVCDWQYKNMNDLSFAIEAKKQGVSLYLAARRRNWVVFQEENQADSIYAALRHNDEKQSALARQLLALERQSPGVAAPAS